MKKITLSFVLMLVLLACKTSQVTYNHNAPITGTISNENFINCFADGLSAAGKPVWCEASAVLFDGSKIILANDKPMPNGQSSVFYWNNLVDFEANAEVTYIADEKLQAAIKFEDFALTPNKKTIFLTTAFDRVKEGSTEWDGFNTLLAWENRIEAKPSVLTLDGAKATSSVSMRSMIANALVNSNADSLKTIGQYFKIEGLAATETHLYLGVREQGLKFDNFKYVTKILAIPYTVENESVKLKNDVSLVAAIDLNTLATDLPKGLALSSIEYDAFRKTFWILTSFENPITSGGAYLWKASLDQLKNNRMELIKTASGEPLKFTHKAEDLSFISTHKLLIIHDDDRINTAVGSATRKPHQAAYSIVELK